MRLAALTAAAVLFAAPAASACSMADWNSFETFAERRQPTDLERATFVERVRFDALSPAACPRFPLDDGDAEPLPAAPACDDGPSPPGLRLMLTANVMERFKGQGSDRFRVLLSGDQPMFMPRWEQWATFPDLRVADALTHAAVALREKARADGGHRGDVFWDRGTLGPFGMSSGACGLDLAIDPALSYLLVRDAAGLVIAAEPVLHHDDELLSRLRLQAAGAEPLIPTRSVADYFRGAAALVLVRVTRCWNGRGYANEGAAAVVLRGDARAFRVVDPETGKPDATGGFDFGFLADWAESRGHRCAEGEVLIADGVFATDQQVRFDEAYAIAQVPEIDRAVLAQWTAGPAFDLWLDALRRPAAVRRGEVRRSELITGLRLDGPDVISVDQAFAWFEEGRAGRGRGR